jgi:AraC family transcriptional regulator
LLIATEHGERYDGETQVEGLPISAARKVDHKLTFVPAGLQFHAWHKPRTLARANFFYIDPKAPLLDSDFRFAETVFKPRLHFFDRDLWETAMKIRAQVESPPPRLSQYGEALSQVLLHELLKVNSGGIVPEPVVHGGLATWQIKRVMDYIEDHLAEDISMSTLAEQVNLSPYHFSRTFRQSFAMPPHRYHINLRIEHAKRMLANMTLSVTEIGQRLGFCESSAFTATFRRFTGRTPTDFRRSLY